jgi:hypothetical protein
MQRLDALENLRLMTCGVAIFARFNIGAQHDATRYLPGVEQILFRTQWAMQENWCRSRTLDPYPHGNE